MANSNISFSLKPKSEAARCPDLDICEPYLFEDKAEGTPHAVIRQPSGALFFNGDGGGICYMTGGLEDVQKHIDRYYTFIRKLGADESVSFTGAR